MSTFDAERLYALLPALYRIRDAERDEPLRALLAVIAEQAGILEENLEQLYDDQFVETCAPWVLPYLGDLLGLTGLPGEPLDARAEVAHTLGYRRRKGTAAVLEQLARDVTGLSARAVEFFELLATTQYLNHLRPENRAFVSVRSARRLEHLGGPFERLDGQDDLPHTADVRRISSPRAGGRGRYNIPNIGLFLWRLRAYRLTRSPAVPAASGDRRRFRFSPLGSDTQLFTRPETEDEITHLAEPINVPAPITRRTLDADLAAYYGGDRSLLLERPGTAPTGEPTPIPLRDEDEEPLIVVCDLTAWETTSLSSPVVAAVDPVLGRILFAADQTQTPLVTFHYGFGGDLGGGEYARAPATDSDDRLPVRVANTPQPPDRPPDFATIQAALDSLGTQSGVIEIADSGRYAETLSPIDAANRRVTIRAADGFRPTLVLGGELRCTGTANDAVTLDGLLLTGNLLRVTGDLGRLRLLHCTLVPGGARPATPLIPLGGGTHSLQVEGNTEVEIDHCILGGIQAAPSAHVRVIDSILDATDKARTAYDKVQVLLDAPAGIEFGAPLHVENSTIIGTVRTEVLEMASNTLFLSPVRARRRQAGCARFSYLPPGSETPRRYRCQPETEADDGRVRPVLTSLRYGDAAYCQLSAHSPDEVRRGADDESEMGAFHDLFLPRREAHLKARLDEYLRFGLEAGIFYAT